MKSLNRATGFAVILSTCLVASTAIAADMTAMPVEAVTAGNTFVPTWTTTFASEVRYFTWQSTRGTPASVDANNGSGTQVYTPFALQLGGQSAPDHRWQFLARGGWVKSRQSTGGLSGDVDTMTDTLVSATYTHLGFAGLQPFLSVSANLPSGRAALFGTAANARMDPDLVEMSSFGEGWNVGPTLGFNLPVSSSLLLSMSAGYTWRGVFEREASLARQDPSASPAVGQIATALDPGDVATVVASLTHASGPWSAAWMGSISDESTTREDGQPLYRPGLRYFTSLGVNHSWAEQWGTTSLLLSVAHSTRNSVLMPGISTLVTEPFNANANVYRIGLQHLFNAGAVAIGPVGSFLYRDRNAYEATTFQFVPAKQRHAAGVLARYAPSNTVTLNLRAEHIWIHEDRRDAADNALFSVLANQFVRGSAVPVVSGTGWQVATGINVQF